MSGIDYLLSNSLSDVVRKNLGSQTLKKIESRLFEKFGISFTQSIKEFDKMDIVLREFFGKGADGLEKKFFENIFHSQSKNSKNNWYTIVDPKVNQIILESFGDLEKKKILESISDQPKIIFDILKDCSLPQTSGYRKINQLIDDGLIFQKDFILRDNKKINKYLCVFNNLKINIEKNIVTVEVQLSKTQENQSLILQTIKL